MSRPTVKALALDLLGKARKLLAIWRFQLWPAARSVDILENGNHLVKLTRHSPLGKRGSILELPRDKVMFGAVQRSGYWDLELSHFLREGLDGKQMLEEKSALLDIGANTGLVTLQTMNIAAGRHDYFLFEPIPRHVSAIRRNLSTPPLDRKFT